MDNPVPYQPSLSRRSFLKTACAVGATGVAAGGLPLASQCLAPVSAHAESEEHIACTLHQTHCAGSCSLQCTVRDGRLVKIEPNEHTPERYSVACLRGISEVQRIYGDGRIQTPLKRVGERGEGAFEAVSWDEALDDICNQIKEIQREYGTDAVLVSQSGEPGVDFHFMSSILNSATTGAQNQGIDVGIGNGFDPTLGGVGGGFAMVTSEPRDWVHSKLVLTVGSNFCESSLVSCREFFEAKEAGAKMITIDPHYSTTASKSTEWVPIEPGTDAAFYLGMISHIVENNLIDTEFIQKHTSLPFLVDQATGKMVRAHEPVEVIDAETDKPRAETGEENPFFVIDPTTGEAIEYNRCENPQLEGNVNVNGTSATTAYSLMKKNQESYSTVWAESITGIPAAKIEEIAELYAEGPAAIAFGWGGGDKMSNADIAGHAIGLITSLTGNIGKHGAGSGVWLGAAYSSHHATLGAWPLPENMIPGSGAYDLRYVRDSGEAPKAMICIGDNPAQYGATAGKTWNWLNKIDLIVMIDPYHRETEKYADYVLPTTTRFERDDECGTIVSGFNQIVMQQKVIDPLFEAKTGLWIEREFAKRFDCEDALPKDGREYCEALLANSEDPYYNQLTVDDIMNNGGVWPMENVEEPRLANFDLVFATPSTRLEPYYENRIDVDQALPTWVPCNEATADNPLREKYPLQLSNVRSRFYIHNQMYSNKWLQAYNEPHIELNPADMDTRELSNGDAVNIFNDRGSFSVPVLANSAVRPGSARIIEGVTSDYSIKGNLQDITNDKLEERGASLLCGPVVPFSDTLVEVTKA
ncbi:MULTISPECIES: molybdopterin-dependent oxidoreductase [unclassified Adlercreutzia]|uniref:molybdopterin-dependent oxidoreductase n=1 Tax=unclassified Adlercreutzia TaxID=2636013 RepID=UPI0013EDC266|nr:MULTISPECIES: molybdopterin-dependent oxidoreductase [unclassified Adlercreutzia]